MLEQYHIILGSQSPRRQELLKGLDIDFEVYTIPNIEEHYPSTLQAEAIPQYLACQKADAYINLIQANTLLITADTIVWLDNQVFGKPTDKADAKRMLQALSGRTHQVITGVCISTKERKECFSATSYVTFAVLADDEIDYYLEKYQPMDKAGSYGVQEWIGYIGVEHIEGSYYNVMGLPIQRLYQMLKTF